MHVNNVIKIKYKIINLYKKWKLLKKEQVDNI